MRYLTALTGSILLGLGTIATAQQAPTCEQQVGSAYLQLVTDKLLADLSGATWPSQLQAITSRVRTGTTSVLIKQAQATQAENNVADLMEQLRLLQGRNADLQKDLDAARNGGKPPGN